MSKIYLRYGKVVMNIPGKLFNMEITSENMRTSLRSNYFDFDIIVSAYVSLHVIDPVNKAIPEVCV